MSVFGNVISVLMDSKGWLYISYRDFKLTRILEDLFGGNCIIIVIVMVLFVFEVFVELLLMLKFVSCVKEIKNMVMLNEDLD